MAATRKSTTVFEVVVSFDGLNKGERFTLPEAEKAWALKHVETGYLQVVPEEGTDERSEVSQG